jgi:hypothetical protein
MEPSFSMRTDGRRIDRQTDRDRQAGRQTDVTNLIVAVRNFANAPDKNDSKCKLMFKFAREG